MKRLIVLIAILVAGVSYAVINPIQSTALNAATYTAITAPSDMAPEGRCVPITSWVDDGTAWNIASDAAGTDGATVPANASYTDDCIKPTRSGNTGVLFYALASAGTPNLIVIVGNP